MTPPNIVNTIPENAVLVRGTVAANNALSYTADEDGAAGRAITVAYIVAGNNTALSVAVTLKAIVVNVATGAGGLATSTGALVRTAVRASSASMALLSVEHTGASTGAGIVVASAAANLAARSSSVETHTVITDPTGPLAVQIPPQADASGRDELAVHSETTPNEDIEAFV